MKYTRTILAASCLAAGVASADDGFLDVRTAYMGGAGVAGQRADAGIQLNPANLAMPLGKERFGLTLPAVTVGADDPHNMKDQIDTIQNDDINQITNDINTLQGYANSDPLALVTPNSPSSPAMSDLGQRAGQLESNLRALNNEQAFANAAAGTGLAIPGKQLGFGFDVKADGNVVGTPQISAQDLQLLDEMKNVFSKGYVTVFDRLQYPELFNAGFSPASYNSTSAANLLGVVQSEAGVSLAHQFAMQEPDQALAIGVKPKVLQLRTYDYTQLFSSSSGFKTSDIKNFSTTTSMVNFDTGLTYQANSNWRAAVVADNVISKNLTTVTGRTISIDPKVTAGMAYRSKFFNWSLDGDLTTQKGFGNDNNTQFLATGVEFNAWNFIRLGVGFRHNLIHDDVKDVATAGISTSLLGLNAGVAVAAASHDLSGTFQLSLEY